MTPTYLPTSHTLLMGKPRADESNVPRTPWLLTFGYPSADGKAKVIFAQGVMLRRNGVLEGLTHSLTHSASLSSIARGDVRPRCTVGDMIFTILGHLAIRDDSAKAWEVSCYCFCYCEIPCPKIPSSHHMQNDGLALPEAFIAVAI